MALATTAYIKEVGNFRDVTGLTPALNRAVIRMKKLVGETVYAEAEAEIAAATGSTMASTLKEAEAMLAVAEAIRARNRSDTGRGINVSAGDQGLDGNQTTSYLSPAQIEREVAALTSQAERLLQDYLVTTTGPTPAYGSASD